MNLAGYYNQIIFKHPLKVLFFFACLFVTAAFYSTHFELDASGESLVLENDQSLNYYREISQRYTSDDFVVITFEPHSGLLSEQSLKTIRSIRDQLLKLDNIAAVTSILDVPIIYQSDMKLSEIAEHLQTLDKGNVSVALASKEFQTNPLYNNLLVSKDGKITALQALFKRDTEYYNLLEKRNELTNKNQSQELEVIQQKIKQKNRQSTLQREKDIKQIRDIIDAHRTQGTLYLGGVPMIVVDMIQFIRHDLVVFGAGVLCFLLLILTFFFHKLRWVMLPLLVCAITGVLTIGFLGYAGWAVTVISSNFLSILLIITLSLTIHLIVRFRDLQIQHPQAGHKELIDMTTSSMFHPCLYTILTTIVAFASLVVSEIRPVIDFGWIMVIGLGIAFITSFTVMPAILSLLGDIEVPSHRDITKMITMSLARFVHAHSVLIVISSAMLIVLIGSGIFLLKVENRFINNFKSHTEIYQGMKVIDHQLGGTMPLDIVIDPDQDFIEVQKELAERTNELDELFFDDEAAETSYWLNPNTLDKGKKLQQYLESYPVIGKVISIVTSINIVEKLNGAPFDEFELAVVRKRIPDNITDELVQPYLSEDSNEARFNMRIIESDPNLNRKQLLTDIHDYLINEAGFEEGQVHLTGMMVLYNNMLQSLFRSQILTIGAVFVAILIMFMILFRNIQLALIAIIPNIFSAVLILGLMGIFGIPLDMMTITIASITIGISVDDTIHYIHRMQKEYPLDMDYEAAIDRCHGGIGKAMYYTSVAIIFGFGILSFSNFIPTINFGLLTGLAMFVALVGDLLLLPAIIRLTKPRIP